MNPFGQSVDLIFQDISLNAEKTKFLIFGTIHLLGEVRKQIGNTVQISAKVGKVHFATNLEHIDKFTYLIILVVCVCTVYMVLKHQIGYVPSRYLNFEFTDHCRYRQCVAD